MSRKKIDSLLLSLMCHTLIISILLVSVFGFAFHREYYYQQFEKLNLSEELKVSQEDLGKSINVLLEYLEGKRDIIDVVIEKHGIEREAFHEEEYEHMIDVRNLSLGAQKVMWVSLAITFCISVYGFLRLKKELFLAIALRYRKAAIVWIVFFSILGLWILADFTTFWTTFHKVFFTNDLWLLNPATDFMIQILPEPIFMGLVVRIVGGFVGGFISLLIVSQIYTTKKSKQMGKER